MLTAPSAASRTMMKPRRCLLSLAFIPAICLLSCGSDTGVGSGPGPGDVAEIGTDIGGDALEGCIDEDGDGYGPGCALGPDCDDGSRRVHPGAEELCGDGIDNNCDGQVDEGCPCRDGAVQRCYTGRTGTEGVGICRAGFQVCDNERWGLCLNEVTPQEEVCDRLDNNCDGQVDEGLLNACGTCGAPPAEICGDGLDNNCDGTIDETSAGCHCDGRTNQPCYSGPPQTLGVGVCRGGRADCMPDGNWGPCRGEVLPSEEICDGLDNNCNGLVDEGVRNACGECDAETPEEVCDGLDNNCNGLIDEFLLLICGVCPGDEGVEECNGFDDNCDGRVDEGCPCVGETRCYPGPPHLAGIGECRWGTRTCEAGGEFWGPCVGYGLPQPEICDGLDNDCDGTIDLSPQGCSVCHTDPEVCDNFDNNCNGVVDEYLRNACGQCLESVVPEELCGPECCDGLDNDCDGLVDEGLLNACGTCGETCYVDHNVPDEDDVIGDGGILIDANHPDNPTGLAGITLSSRSVIPPYLWVANHTQNTVSRFNTTTLQEEGRYWVAVNPSRTGVDLDGNVWIGGRDDGRLTKILWDPATCPDRNENGVIDTVSRDNLGPINSAGDPYADECVVYSEVPNPARPSIRGSAPGPDGTIWIGYSGGGIGSIHPTTFELGPFVPATGAPLYAPDGSGVQQPLLLGDGSPQTGNTGGVYGLVVDSRGHVYTSSYNRNTLARFDTHSGQWLAMYTGVVCGSYGIAVDARNRIWMGGWPGCRGVGMFDPATNRVHNFAVPTSLTLAPGATSGVDMNPTVGACGSPNLCVTGLASEPATGDIWASFYGVGYTGRLRLDEGNLANSQWTFIGTTRDAGGALLSGVGADLRGVGFDYQGYAWTHGLGSGRVWMIDPATNQRAAALPNGLQVGANTHYTYSDFTGSTALSFTAPRSFWRYEFDTGYPNASADRLVWRAYVPPLTTAGIRIRGLDAARNPTGPWFPAPSGDGTAVYQAYPEGAASATFDVTSASPTGSYFEVEVRLATSDATVKPIVHGVDIHWQRP
jgi:hypothetical protein